MSINKIQPNPTTETPRKVEGAPRELSRNLMELQGPEVRWLTNLLGEIKTEQVKASSRIPWHGNKNLIKARQAHLEKLRLKKEAKKNENI